MFSLSFDEKKSPGLPQVPPDQGWRQPQFWSATGSPTARPSCRPPWDGLDLDFELGDHLDHNVPRLQKEGDSPTRPTLHKTARGHLTIIHPPCTEPKVSLYRSLTLSTQAPALTLESWWLIMTRMTTMIMVMVVIMVTNGPSNPSTHLHPSHLTSCLIA